MTLNLKQYVCGAAVLLLAVPIWASRTDSAQVITSRPLMVGKTNLQPGNYTIRAEESENKLEVLKNGRVVATAPCHWVELPRKADDTEVSQNGSQLVQVQFAGRTEAIQLQ